MSMVAFTAKMGGEWYDIRFQYNPDLVTMIKTVIPATFRKYEPATKTWSAQKTYAQAFAMAARSAGHTTNGIADPGAGQQSSSTPPPPGSAGFFASSHTRPNPPPRQPPPRQPPPMPPPPPALSENWARELMRRTPPELREKLYKNLAKVLHEDLGGDGRLMQELNDARNGLAS
jgi:hypothetical protein